MTHELTYVDDDGQDIYRCTCGAVFEANGDIVDAFEHGYTTGADATRREIELLREYGRAKFGDEWWPGNAVPWVGVKLAREMDALGIDQGDSIDRWVDELRDAAADAEARLVESDPHE
jgi:hypothetical protein